MTVEDKRKAETLLIMQQKVQEVMWQRATRAGRRALGNLGLGAAQE